MSSKTKIYVLITVVVGIGLGSVFLASRPLFEDIKDRSQRLTTIKKNKALLAQAEQDLIRAKSILDQHQQDLKKMENLFINPEEPVQFIAFLEKQAAKSDLDFKISSLGPTGKEKPWPSFEFKIRVAGSGQDFLRFLEKLESAPYLVKITKIQVNRVGEKGVGGKEKVSVGDVEASINIITYYRAQANEDHQ